MKNGPDSILDAAEALFGARGCDGVSTRVIAEAAGVNIAMLSYYFGSKEGLFKAMLQRRCLTLDTLVNQTINSESPSSGIFRRFLTVCAHFLVLEHPAFLAVLVRESTSSQATDRATLIGELTLPLRRTFGEILDSRETPESHTGGDSSFAIMLGIFAAASVSPPFAHPAKEDSVEWLVDTVLRALGTDDSLSGTIDAARLAHGQREELILSQPDSFEIGMVD
ncbi:MAG: TetR/AcrR family transcriptional regulator [Candidatus Hydrogenedentes bacterium]|nr:TetR/AcrR family transcriptional regulator [Candidatus Hydrogenedentota bacterium]